tara:strand:- start:1877 stop:2380 length:504 start_codon:yes stop_codon:yes gene_type:complete
MALDTKIITATEVKDLAIFDKGFDEAYFTNYILTTQRKYIRPVLGADYYDELLTQIETTTVSADNQIILDSFVDKMLAHYVVYVCYSKVHIQLTNQGSMLNDTEFSNQGKSSDYAQSRDFYVSMADDMKVNLIEYIKEAKELDSTKYPLFNECGDIPQVNKRGIILY